MLKEEAERVCERIAGDEKLAKRLDALMIELATESTSTVLFGRLVRLLMDRTLDDIREQDREPEAGSKTEDWKSDFDARLKKMVNGL